MELQIVNREPRGARRKTQNVMGELYRVPNRASFITHHHHASETTSQRPTEDYGDETSCFCGPTSSSGNPSPAAAPSPPTSTGPASSLVR